MENSGRLFFSQLKDKATEFLGNSFTLFRLQAISKLSKLVSMAIVMILLAVLGGMILLFLSLMGGYFFSDLFDSTIKGFGLIALIYIILFLLALKFSGRFLKRYIASRIINIIFEKTADNDDDDEK